MLNETQNDSKNTIDTKTKKHKVIIVKSFSIAQSLCADYPYFKYLLYRKPDRDDPTGKRHIWIFDGHDEEFVNTFLDLCEQSIQYRRKRILMEAEGSINAAE